MMRATFDIPVEELHARLSLALREHRLSGWALGFAKGFVATCKRGRTPSDKQFRAARRVLAELRGASREIDVLDREDNQD